jgi:hypothetical protein
LQRPVSLRRVWWSWLSRVRGSVSYRVGMMGADGDRDSGVPFRVGPEQRSPLGAGVARRRGPFRLQLGPRRGGVAPGGPQGASRAGRPPRGGSGAGRVLGGGASGADPLGLGGSASGVEPRQGQRGAMVAGELEGGVLVGARRPVSGVRGLFRFAEWCAPGKSGGVAQAQTSAWRAPVVPLHDGVVWSGRRPPCAPSPNRDGSHQGADFQPARPAQCWDRSGAVGNGLRAGRPLVRELHLSGRAGRAHAGPARGGGRG